MVLKIDPRLVLGSAYWGEAETGAALWLGWFGLGQFALREASLMITRFTRVYPRACALPAALVACFIVPGHAIAGDRAMVNPETATHAARPLPQVAVPRSQAGAIFYARRFGVDDLGVRYTASGSLLEFHYRVVDPAKATALGNAKAAPELVDQRSGTRLRVPEVEQVGALRQEGRLQEGRVYWVMFPNPGKSIRRGDRVDIVIGNGFRVSGLVVE